MVRKILLLFTSIMMALGMVACGGAKEDSNTPEGAVMGYLEGMKTTDQAKVNQYVTEDDFMYTDDMDTDTSNTEAGVLFKSATYEIKSVDAEEGSDKAVVTVDITNVDMEKIYEQYSDVMEEKESEEEILEALRELIEENKGTTVTNTVDIEVTQVEGEWKVTTTMDIISAFAGGLVADV